MELRYFFNDKPWFEVSFLMSIKISSKSEADCLSHTANLKAVATLPA